MRYSFSSCTAMHCCAIVQQRWLIAGGKEQLTDADTELLGTAKFVHDNRALMLFGAGPR
jgi:hypothetical protein